MSIELTPWSPNQNVQGSAKRWVPGCVYATGKARQNWQATIERKFTKPGTNKISELCMDVGWPRARNRRKLLKLGYILFAFKKHIGIDHLSIKDPILLPFVWLYFQTQHLALSSYDSFLLNLFASQATQATRQHGAFGRVGPAVMANKFSRMGQNYSKSVLGL